VIGAWLLFPVILIALALGCGLLFERCARITLPGALIMPVGAAVMIALGQLTTATDATAEITPWAVVALAVAGFATAPGRALGLRPDPWLLGAFLVVAFIYGAPVILSGEPTFLGYIRLDDTATWLALTDRVMEHGHSLDGLAPSTYEATLAFNLRDGYPVGVFVPLGIGSALTGIDPAWIVQPYISLLAAMLVPVLWHLFGSIVEPRPARALAAAIAAQPALLVGYAQWGGIKEVAAASLIALCAALALRIAREDSAPGWIAALAVSISALLAVLSLGGLVWVLPLLLGVAFYLYRRTGRGEVLQRAGLLAGGVALISLPLIVPVVTEGRLLPPTSSSLASETAQGNLIEPLGLERLAGIWPAGDFRLGAVDETAAVVLIALVFTVALWGLVVSAGHNRPGVVLFALGTLAGFAVLYAIGSPWVDGKALATASPALLALAVAGAFALVARGFTLVGGFVLTALFAGVLWSNALAFRDANLAPYDQMRELERIGEEIAGEGPALMTEYQPYGARHFLREADAEAASELRRRLVPLRNGGSLEKGLWADTDDFDPAALQIYRTLVLRRSPEQSRPLGDYELVLSGEHYEVWQRPEGIAEPSGEHFPLGGGVSPAAPAPCTEVRRLAQGSRELAYVSGPAQVALDADGLSAPAEWSGSKDVLVPSSDGVAEASVEVPTAGAWRVWVGGSVRGRLTVTVDGEDVGSARHQLSNSGLYVDLGAVSLDPGLHQLALAYEGPSVTEPGSGNGSPEGIGPVVLASDARDYAVRMLPSERASELCGQTLDWIESRP